MIPIRNKKKTLEMTVEEMRNFAFTYVEKYAPSKQQLKTYLLKKYLKSSVPNVKKKDVTDLIDIVLSDLEKNKFINDKFYSETKAKSMIRRGNSINKIRRYLIGKGICKTNFLHNNKNKKSIKSNFCGIPPADDMEIYNQSVGSGSLAALTEALGRITRAGVDPRPV